MSQGAAAAQGAAPAQLSPPEPPPALRRWFVVHFVADWLFALPLFLFPEPFLLALGWTHPDAALARVVAAALVGIGTQSLRDRNGTLESFKSLLELKILWSSTAAVGLLWSALTVGPAMAWGFFLVFVAFNALWTYWRLRVGRLLAQR
jgi:hypothetical protein